MENSRRLTPEEKLLHIIEKPDEAHKIGLNKKKGFLKRGKGLGLFKKISPKKITLHGINKIIISVSVIATIALVILFMQNEKMMTERFGDLKKDIQKETFRLSETKEEKIDLATYLEDTEKKNPFHVLPVVKKIDILKEEEPKIELKLVGIIWSDKPQAIIEDDATKKNYLLFEGDAIDKYTVEKITKTQVKLVSEDAEKILR